MLVISFAVLMTTLLSYRMYASERDARTMAERRREEAVLRRDVAERELATSRSDGSTDARFHAHEGRVERLGWSPDGLYLVSAGEDHNIRYGSADGERVLRMLHTTGPPRSVEVSPRGSYLYFQDGNTLVRLDANPPVDARDPAALLRISEGRAGLRLQGLELVPAD